MHENWPEPTCSACQALAAQTPYGTVENYLASQNPQPELVAA